MARWRTLQALLLALVVLEPRTTAKRTFRKGSRRTRLLGDSTYGNSYSYSSNQQQQTSNQNIYSENYSYNGVNSSSGGQNSNYTATKNYNNSYNKNGYNNRNSYNRNSSSSSSSSSYNSYYSVNNPNSHSYSVGYYNGARDFSVCDGSVIQVVSLNVLCDSPYTFYYGNGANRHSPVCNYGDKMTVQVVFQVVDDIKDSDPIYMAMAVYDDQGSLLISTQPAYLCEFYVGKTCKYAGSYGFSTTVRLQYPAPSSSNTASDRFLPSVHMAFSTQPDSGYNLGAINIQCQQWESTASTWASKKAEKTPFHQFVLSYGLLMISCSMLITVSAYLWKQTESDDLVGGLICAPDEKKNSLMENVSDHI